MEILVALITLVSIVTTIVIAIRPPSHEIIDDKSKLLIAVYFLGIVYSVGATAWCFGQIGRGTLSPLPWIAYSNSLTQHGLLTAMNDTGALLIAEIWLLWIPGQLYVVKHCKDDRVKAKIVRLLNIAVGFLMLTPGSPVHWLFDAISRIMPQTNNQ